MKGGEIMLVFLSGGGGASTSITDILAMASSFFTWVMTNLGTLIDFIFAHPLIIMPFIIAITGSIFGFFKRVWHSV